MFAYWTIPFFGCGIFLIGCLAVAYKQYQEEQRERQNARHDDDEDDIEKQQKIEAVENKLVLQAWKDVKSDEEQQQQTESSGGNSKSSSSYRSSLDVSYHAGTIIPDENNDTDAETASQDDQGDVCGICLISFEHNDLVGSSTNASCSHHFHKDCITEWLSKHDECPFCRETFLVGELDRNQEENEESEQVDDADRRDTNYTNNRNDGMQHTDATDGARTFEA